MYSCSFFARGIIENIGKINKKYMFISTSAVEKIQ